MCVCVCERERAREEGGRGENLIINVLDSSFDQESFLIRVTLCIKLNLYTSLSVLSFYTHFSCFLLPPQPPPTVSSQ